MCHDSLHTCVCVYIYIIYIYIYIYIYCPLPIPNVCDIQLFILVVSTFIIIICLGQSVSASHFLCLSGCVRAHVPVFFPQDDIKKVLVNLLSEINRLCYPSPLVL